MVKVYATYNDGKDPEIDLVSKADFDRAISLLKLHKDGFLMPEDYEKAIKQTEEFLEECK